MTQIEQKLNSKFEEILKENRTNRDSNLANDKEDAENNRPSTSKPENKFLRKKHASNIENNKNRFQDIRFPSSDMDELRQASTPFGVVNETLDDTIIINENRQEADYHMVTGPTKNILRQSSSKTNITKTLGRNAEHLFLKHPEPPDTVNQIPKAIGKLARKNPKPSTSKVLH